MHLFGKPSSWSSQDFPYRITVVCDQAYSISCHSDCWTGDQILQVEGLFSFHHCAQNKAEINPGSLETKWPQHTTDHFPSLGSKVENVCSFASTAASYLHSVVLRPVGTSSSLYFSNLLIKLLVCSTEQHDTTMCRGADKSLARPTSRCILFDGEIFRLMLVLLYI